MRVAWVPDLTEIDRFLDGLWMERGLSQNTLAAYRQDLTGFSLWLSKKALDKQQPEKKNK